MKRIRVDDFVIIIPQISNCIAACPWGSRLNQVNKALVDLPWKILVLTFLNFINLPKIEPDCSIWEDEQQNILIWRRMNFNFLAIDKTEIIICFAKVGIVFLTRR